MRPGRETGVVAVFSAVGSIPVHAAPVIVTLLTEAGLGRYRASLVLSAFFVGEFALALLFPFLSRFGEVRSKLHLSTLLILPCVGLTASAGFGGLVAIFLAIGALSGLCSQIGILAAARSAIPFTAFIYRLSAAIVLSGIVMVAGPTLPFAEGYAGFAAAYVAVAAAFMLPCVRLARLHPPRSRGPTETRSDFSFTREGVRHLAALLLYFAAIVAYLSQAQVLFPVAATGDTISMAIGLSKLVGGMAVFAVAVTLMRNPTSAQGMAAILLLAAAFLFGPWLIATLSGAIYSSA